MIDLSPIQEVPPPITIPDNSYRLQTSSLAGPQDYQLHDGALLQLDLGTELTLIAEPANPHDKYPARVPARKQPPRLPPPGQVTTSSPAASNKAPPSLPKSPGSTAKKIPPSPSTSTSKKSPHKSDGSRQLRFWPPTKLPKTKYSPFKNRCSTFSALPTYLTQNQLIKKILRNLGSYIFIRAQSSFITYANSRWISTPIPKAPTKPIGNHSSPPPLKRQTLAEPGTFPFPLVNASGHIEGTAPLKSPAEERDLRHRVNEKGFCETRHSF